MVQPQLAPLTHVQFEPQVHASPQPHPGCVSEAAD
jgi:hypothetical protein